MAGRPIDLVGKRAWFYLFSIILILPGVISLMIPPRLKPGIDFSSGSTFTVRFEKPLNADDLKAELTTIGHSEARVQRSGENEFLVRTKTLRGATSAPPVGPAPPSERNEIDSALRERFGNLTNTNGVASDKQGFLEFNSISATVSRDIAKNAGYALVAASGAIFLYLWWSFRAVPKPFRFGAAAVLALLHDALLVVGAFSILGKLIDTEINVMFVTAILTVIGFSVHDSIVVFDRIRETVGRGEGGTFAEAVNTSLLQTMGRSLNTTLALVFAILALLLIGGGIEEFLWAMLIGVATGAYSSVFIASQILVSWDEGDVPRLFRRVFRRPQLVEEEYEVEPAPAM